jgi:glucose/arabinose dehydrogenase
MQQILRPCLGLAIQIGATSLAATALAGTPLTTIRVASGLSRPLFAGSPPGDYKRIFIVEENSGKIKIWKAGEVLATPFLDIRTKISNSGERGLLGLAFHPNYANNGTFFVFYTRAGDNADVLARYQVTADPNVADPNSETVLFAISDPYENHNGGMLAFSPHDGYLYIGTGDGGSGNDPGNRAQDGSQMLGKMLRIDVDNGNPYSSPPSNPFFGPGDPLDEIWAIGMRNPWRWSFDRLTGDLYIADVGQDAREEIDFQSVNSTGGENYGWRCMEGLRCTGLSGCTCNDASLTLPIHDYTHSDGCSVIGGYVYRGNAIPDLQGTYFFADYCSNHIWSFRYDGTTMTEFTDRSAELAPGGGLNITSIVSFGEDAFGEMYICDSSGGELFKIVPKTPIASWANYGTGWPGTNGTPDLTLSNDPELCFNIQLVIGNSLGAPTTALLPLGSASGSFPTPYDGTLLVTPAEFLVLPLPTGTATIPVVVPCDPALSGRAFYMQSLEIDAGASKGVSFSAGLQMVLGPQG